MGGGWRDYVSDPLGLYDSPDSDEMRILNAPKPRKKIVCYCCKKKAPVF